METRQLRVQSLIKHSIDTPWIVSYVALSGIIKRASIDATDGGASVGPRLDEVLSSIERKVDVYPFQYAWDDFLNDTVNLFNARMNGDQLVHLEIGIRLRTLLMNIGPSDHVNKGVVDLITITPTQSLAAPVTTSEFKAQATADSNPQTDYFGSPDWLIVGHVDNIASIVDGDTIDNFIVDAVGKNISTAVPQFTVNGATYKASDGSPYSYDPVIKVGDKINIRFEGINAPEILAHGYAAAIQRDDEYCTQYGVSAQDAIKVGDEAWKFTQAALQGAVQDGKNKFTGYIVLDVDSHQYQDDNGVIHDVVNRDKYGRTTATVYKTSITDPNEIFNNTTGKKYYGENICKTEIMTPSSIVKGSKGFTPLAIPYYDFIENDPGRINVGQWLVDAKPLLGDTGILPGTDGNYGLGDLIKQENKKLKDEATIKNDPTKPPKDGFITQEVKLTETYNNQIDFITPEDDRFQETFPLDKEGNIQVSSKVRIGDVALIIPPLSIEVNNTSSITKIKTLRTRQSMKIKAGSSTTMLTLQLYFHDLDSINGYPRQMNPALDKRYYYLDGLRPLIAQFKKAPFLPIDNEYINNTLGVHEVALVNLAIQTVPGFPHSLTATLTLAEFDIDAYMPQLDRLANAINYPLLRWYYNQSMRDDLTDDERSQLWPTRTYLQPIPASGLSNAFVFQMVNEQDLINRQQALKSMRYLDDPQTAADKFNNPTNQLNPSESILNPLQMQNSVGSPTAMDDGTKNPLDTSNPNNTLLGRMYADGWAAQHILTHYNNYIQARQDSTLDWSKFNQTTDNGNGVTSNNGDFIASSDHTWDSQGTNLWKTIYGDVKDSYILGVSHFAPTESYIFTKDRETVVSNMGNDAAKAFDNHGAIKIRLYEQTNINLFPKQYRQAAQKDGDFTDLIVPADDINIIQKIIDNGKSAEAKYVKNIEDYEKTKKILDETEADFNMYDYDIPGLFPTSMQVAYENQFSQAQLLELGSPTFQFLGGQDPFIQVDFEADEDALQKLKFMVSEAERFSRTYRTGITSGFLGLKNDLMGLFGIKTIMIENVQYRTVPGFPGRFQVTMNLCGFDKTQKSIEGLNGISPIAGAVTDNPLSPSSNQDSDSLYQSTRASREAASYNPEIDQAIIDFKMRQMEVYPDLELPKYDELNADLQYINSQISVYENRTGGVYVDPDFYVATPVTLRQVMNENVKKEITLSIKDIHGVQMTSSSQSPNLLDGTDDMWSLLMNIDGNGPKLDPQFSWDGNVAAKKAANKQAANIKYKSPEVKKFISDRNNLKTYPTVDQFNTWGLDQYYRDYQDFLSKAQPSEASVYTKIYDMIDKYWTSKGLVYDDTKKDTTDKAWQKITYSTREDMYAVNYDYISSTNPKYLTKKDDTTKQGSLSLSDYKATNSQIPRERLANLVKSIIHTRSSWKQFFGTGLPIVDDTGNAVGIMGVPLTSQAKDVDTAQRLMWDWNYNMEIGFKFLSDAYNGALAQKDIKYLAAPWDWMLYAYSTGNIGMGINTGAADMNDMNNPFITYVYSTFDAYYNRYAYLYAVPSTSVSMDVMSYRNGYDSHQLGIIQGTKSDLITDLLTAGYRKDNDNKADTKKWLEQQNTKTVQDLYDSYMKKFNPQAAIDDHANPAKGDAVGYGGGLVIAGQMSVRQQKADAADKDLMANYALYNKYKEYMDIVNANNLVFNSNPQDIFPKLFIDMIRYDQKFRLLRAFPTFQMFIIDEGRWMTNYKLWDNLYGYNAIQSIDINKSRKIAADTAVISMTNIYSNLTSRTMDTAYGDYDFKFWDNLVWGNPNNEILDARKELLDSMYLQTGARIHLRIGYGSSVPDLPIVFNGTITELDASEVVQIVAQGDGLELTNVISGDPKDTNANWLTCTEPRDLICKLLTSKGNWLKDVISLNTGDEFFRDNPLGIMHFGTPGATPPGNVSWFNHDYGEAAQNIYSSNGLNTFSEYVYQDGSQIPFNFAGPVWDWIKPPGDEANIVVPFYNNTTWDIAQTIAYCSPDYIAAVMPFELRSTLFFGKPYWEVAYQYDSRYEWSEKDKTWTRYKDVEHRKPYMQAHIIDGTMDIISNGLKASAEDIYTNVIVRHGSNTSSLIMADWDIRFDKQTTTVIDAQIVYKPLANGVEFFSVENQAFYYGASALRDYMKDMYKGEILILGDPTIKPYDLIFISDTINSMSGNIYCKAVTHHFSQEMGFVTSIQPDAVVVNDDKALLGLTQWAWTLGIDTASFLVAKKFVARMLRKAIPSHIISTIMQSGGDTSKKVATKVLKDQIAKLPDSDPDVAKFKQLFDQYSTMEDGAAKDAVFQEMKDTSSGLSKKVKGLWKDKSLVNDAGEVMTKSEYSAVKRAAGIVENTVKAASTGAKTVEALGKIGGFLLEDNPMTFIAGAALSIGGEAIAEAYRRKKASLQAVLMYPVTYQGREYTAGITGHKGMVVGDSMGKLDSFYSGLGFDGKKGGGGTMDTFAEWMMSSMNFLTGADNIDYSVTQQDLQDAITQQQQSR